MSGPTPESASSTNAGGSPANVLPAGSHASPTPRRRRTRLIVAGVVLILVLLVAVPWVIRSFRTVSTDDAYVNGHVTFVAPRVPGQVSRVLVEDNNRVRKGDRLVELDREPYEVQVHIAEAAVTAAKSDLAVARAQSRGMAAQARSLRFNLQHAIEEVDNQVALLHSRVATLESQKATLSKTQADYDRVQKLFASSAASQKDFDDRTEAYRVAQARVEEALQGVYQVRVALGLPPRPEKGDDLTQVPADLDQTFSSVRQAQASLMQAASQLGVSAPFSQSPREMIAEFYKRDPSGDIDKIYATLIETAPGVVQSEAKLAQAQRVLEHAKLELSYCNVIAEIDGVVTRRSVNTGNNVVAGQSVMAVRSLTEVWVDANFKETQLGELRIGQSVDIHTDMYGLRQTFKGRISGFTMGTGSTLALLPAENATGNFVKVVQRLPVRIELLDYDADKTPLFIGLSVTPVVHLRGSLGGPDAGKVLQPYLAGATPSTQP